MQIVKVRFLPIGSSKSRNKIREFFQSVSTTVRVKNAWMQLKTVPGVLTE